MTLPDHRLAIRPTAEDVTALEAIAAHLRANGVPFANRTDSIRHALKTTVEAIKGTTGTAGASA